MNILDLETHGFRVLRDQRFELQPDGLTIVIGPNESGKSTFCQAIPAILYGLPESVDTWRAWNGDGDCTGCITIGLGERRIRIERNFLNHATRLSAIDGDAPEVLFEGKANPRGRTDEAKHYRDLLAGLGLPPEAVFRSSGYIGQMDIQVQLDDELRKQISGAGQGDYLRAREQLQTKYYEVTRAGLPGEQSKRTDKRFEQLNAEIEGLSRELEEAQAAQLTLVKARQDRDQAVSKLRKLDQDLSRITSQVKALEKYLILVRERESLLHQGTLQRDRDEGIQKLETEIRDTRQLLDGERIKPLTVLSDDALAKLERYIHSDAENILQQIQKGPLHGPQIPGVGLKFYRAACFQIGNHQEPTAFFRQCKAAALEGPRIYHRDSAGHVFLEGVNVTQSDIIHATLSEVGKVQRNFAREPLGKAAGIQRGVEYCDV